MNKYDIQHDVDNKLSRILCTCPKIIVFAHPDGLDISSVPVLHPPLTIIIRLMVRNRRRRSGHTFSERAQMRKSSYSQSSCSCSLSFRNRLVIFPHESSVPARRNVTSRLVVDAGAGFSYRPFSNASAPSACRR